ncbi:hypothetical protein E8E14_014770 [Neopestalotiopsis sp. 37M]|nr:hypothetical protein E8E14_014770 [Neopestalotiopsis sp. 37M]
MATSTSSSADDAVSDSRKRRPQRPTPREFHVALFCALPLEADATDAVFDEHWDDYQDLLTSKAAGDVNAYTFGRIGKHNVVLVHLAAMGKVHSAAAAAQCRTSFPNIELALIVGICGVAPYTPDKEEIVLGDVIISDGVVQYDLGRQFPTRFIRKDTIHDVLGRPNVQIRSLLAKLRVLRVREELDSKAVHYLERLQKRPKLYAQYPGVEHDRLFESAYRHIGDAGSCDDVECAGTLLTRYRLQPALDHLPVAHLGLIASGDTVMKSGEMRDNITKQEGVIAFEMESAGVWDNFPCIVVKGACDYADSHKSKRWQRYAAATAASYARAFLDYWAPSSKAVSYFDQDCVEALLCSERMSDQLNSLMRPQLQENFDRVENGITQRLAVHISETLIAADSPHSLGWILRNELKRQLTPFSDDFRRVSELLDQTANFVSHQSHDHNIFQSEDHMATQTHVPNQSLTNILTPKVSTGTSQEMATYHKSTTNISDPSENNQLEPRKVPLFSTYHFITTMIGTLVIRVTSYRLSNSTSHQDTKHFQVKITFAPKKQLSLHGLSLAYSSGPDNMGYYDILPRIQLFSVHYLPSPLHDVIYDDDLIGFMEMLQNRTLSLRDRDRHGNNLLKLSCSWQAPSIARYLLHESGYKELVDEMDDEIDFSFYSLFWARFPVNLSDVEELFPLLLECSNPPQPHRRHDYCWAYFYDAICSKGQFQDAAWLARLFLRYGAAFQPFSWGGNANMAKNETLLKLYLETGGDPNFRNELGQSALFWALIVIDDLFHPDTLDRQLPDDESLNEETLGEQKSDGGNLSDQDYRSCVNLIVMLIYAGGDIYEPVDHTDPIWLPSEVADDWEIYHIWWDALSKCGLDEDDVWQESKRRVREMERLRGATRTGVDVQVLNEQHSGLRFRGSRRSNSGS